MACFYDFFVFAHFSCLVLYVSLYFEINLAITTYTRTCEHATLTNIRAFIHTYVQT